MELKIGTVLSQALKEQRRSLREVAKHTGISVSTLNEWASNRHPRDLVKAQKVAGYLGLTLHFLLFGIEDPQEPMQKIISEDFFKGTYEISIKRVRLPKERA